MGKTIWPPLHAPPPPGLAAGTVDSLLNKLDRIDHTNPIAHPRIKEYLNFVRVEQAGMAISPSQAVPLFFVKFQNLITHLRGKLLLIVNHCLELVSMF